MVTSPALLQVLTAPTAEAVWRLRSDLLAAGVDRTAHLWEVLDAFHAFLDDLATRSSSRDFSRLASRMDISAISGVIAEQVLETRDARELATRLFTGLLSEGLMALATRQHVKAWAGEIAAVGRSAAWYLYGALWHWSAEHTPDLGPGERRRLLDDLFAPVLSGDTPDAVKAVVLGRLFQLLLVSELPGSRGPAAGEGAR
jgi:hypothetical protein